MTRPARVTAAQAHCAYAPDLFVLHARPLRSSTALDDTARYGDDYWPLNDAVRQNHQRGLSLDFTTLPASRKAIAKELFYVLLSGPVPPGETRLDLVTIREVFTEVKRFFIWLGEQQNLHDRPLSGLDPTDLEKYQRHLTTVLRVESSRSRARGSVRRFWRYRDHLTDRLMFDPRYQVDGWGEPNRPRVTENATDRIPEQIIGPLLAWAIRFVDDFASDILAADQQWHQHRRHRRTFRACITSADVPQALTEYLARHVADGKPLPGHRGAPNLVSIADAIGATRDQFDRLGLRQQIHKAATAVGVSASGTFDIPIHGQLHGKPWIDGIGTMHKGNAQGLGTLARLLQASCYVLIAYLSGMRDSEIKNLRRGCLHTDCDPDGNAYRWRVKSLAFKGEIDPEGTPASWVVGEPTARAIKMLEQLQPDDTDLLFARLPHGPGTGPGSIGSNVVLVSSSTNVQLNELVAWINAYCAERGIADTIPAINGRPWPLKTSHFRRTLAWFIARRPGGAIAGAIQYRHMSIQMFEGYAGTSDSGFRAEVESEQALARGEHLLAMVDAHEHEDFQGPAADEARRRLETFAQDMRFKGQVITDRRRLLRLLHRTDPAVYPGKYVTCVHNHATALCQQQHDTLNRIRPDSATCKPLACRNVAISADNATSWQTEIDAITARLESQPVLAPLLEQQLLDRRSELLRFLKQHNGKP